MSEITAPVSVFRLRFIDMARAVAILFMLEGHFVELTLAPEWRVKGHLVYDFWYYIRGITAPMFFTVTGLVFAFLMSGAKEAGFFEVPRIQKGLQRAAELMFWGYMLQVNLRQVPDMFRGVSDPWLTSFHVLQCISIGLLCMIGIFGIVRRAGAWALAASYVFSGMIFFMVSVWLANQAGPIPAGGPAILQNAIKGPGSIFPVFPSVGFTMYGAAIGVLVRRSIGVSDQGVSAAPFWLVGIAFNLGGWIMDRFLGNVVLSMTGTATEGRILPDFFHGRISEILIILGILVWIEQRFRPQAMWFFAIGRNTFPIYVGHVIVLYGGIFGIGLSNYLTGKLNPWQAALGAILFCGMFAGFAQWIGPITRCWRGRVPTLGKTKDF